MTLVCAFRSRGGFPILLGDLLVSAPGRETRDILLPTLGRIRQVAPEWDQHGFTGAKQKITIISRDFVLGWSGALVEARPLIKELRDRARANQFDPDGLIRFLDARSDDMTTLELVGIIRYGQHFVPIGWNASRWGEGEEEIIACGTGAGHGVHQTIDDIRAEFPSNDRAPTTFGVALGLTCAARITMDELWTGDSVGGYWYGGGYELVGYSDPVGFFKFSNIAYLFVEYDIVSDAEIVLAPQQIMTLEYQGDYLWMRVDRLAWPDGASAGQVTSTELMLITSILEDYGGAQWSLASRSPIPIDAVACLCRSRDGSRDVFRVSIGSTDGVRPIDFRDTGRQLEMRFSERAAVGLFNAITNSTRARYFGD